MLKENQRRLQNRGNKPQANDEVRFMTASTSSSDLNVINHSSYAYAIIKVLSDD
jgi:hypothetical protein